MFKKNENYKIIEGDCLTGSLPYQCLLLNGEWKDSYLKLFQKGKVNGLRLSYPFWKSSDINFISNIEGLKSLEIYSYEVKDISLIQQMTSLEYLALGCKFTKGIDFSKLPNLTHCSIEWVPKAKTLFDAVNLKYLNISGYKEESLEELLKLTKLQTLAVQSRKLESLSGLSAFKCLTYLDLSYCTNLEKIDELENCELIKTLEFSVCKKVNSISSLSKLRHLKKLLIENCGSINSIKPLENCSVLNELYLIDINIADGDCSPILSLSNLKKIALARHKNHSHTVEEIENILGI